MHDDGPYCFEGEHTENLEDLSDQDEEDDDDYY